MQVQLKDWVIPASVGVASFAAGIVAGHFFTKNKKIDAKIEEAKEELRSENVQLEFKFEEVEQRYAHALQQTSSVIDKFNDNGKSFLERRADPVHQAIKDAHPSNEKRSIILAPISNKDDDTLVVNVFRDDDDDGWDYDVEVPLRGPDQPYVIHRDEYFSDEEGYTQSSLTYYSGDNILCDDQDVPVYNPDKIVGKLEFGKGSRDPNIVYIRNERLEAEYEVLFDPGWYQSEVLGQQIDQNLKHSRPVLKFRME